MIQIPDSLLKAIHAHGEAAYPEEGAGLLLGEVTPQAKVVTRLMSFENAREASARHNRYLLTHHDYLAGEEEAARYGIDVIGVFHSHPDHPNAPSEFDRDWAMPWFSYLITSVYCGVALGTKSWMLNESRSAFDEELIEGVKS